MNITKLVKSIRADMKKFPPSNSRTDASLVHKIPQADQASIMNGITDPSPTPGDARSRPCKHTNGLSMARLVRLAQPNSRRVRSLWEEKLPILPKHKRERIKRALEEDYFLSPEQTEQYFRAIQKYATPSSGLGGGMVSRKEQVERTREFRQRQKWLVNFSAQVAYRLCDYIAKGHKEMLVSNRLRSIADVVLERVAEILGEPKPTRTHPGRLARFMVAISDRIAVWIENAVYRAETIEPKESGVDEHIRLDAEKPLICH